jgi:histidinol-phosphatase (PHP family)
MTPLAENVAAAAARGFTHFAATEHCNLDGDAWGLDWDATDYDAYKSEFMRLRALYADKLSLTFGIEFGYAESVRDLYAPLLQKCGFEYVINSVHLSDDGGDVYRDAYFEGNTKSEAFAPYLTAVRESLDAPFRFDTVGHFGYITRNCPYADRDMYTGFEEKTDGILRAIIARGAALELNSSVSSAPRPSVLQRSILVRYRELGGERITFGSDAHSAGSIGRDRAAVMEFARAAGFQFHLVPDGAKGMIFLPIG